MPTLVVSAGFYALMGPNGFLNEVLMEILDLPSPPIQFVNTFGAILTAHVFYNLAVVIRLVGGMWAHIDPRTEEAARMLGASPWRAFREVTWPLLRTAVISAASIVFLFTVTSFGVVLLLGGLWHGASWTFVVWGAMHGAYLVMNHAWRALDERLGLDLARQPPCVRQIAPEPILDLLAQ